MRHTTMCSKTINKRDWLYNCLVAEINKSQSFSKVFSFLQAVLNPAAYTSADSRQKYRYLFEETNKVLLFAGLSIDQSGRLVAVSQAETLSEVDQRVNHLKKALYDRAIHSEVQKYCVEDYLRADYYDAVFEASKGLAERVRQISGLTTDGGTLFQTVFSKNDPYIFFNAMKTDSERSEFTGLKELLEAIFHLVRNPAAHTPKVNWKTDETKVLANCLVNADYYGRQGLVIVKKRNSITMSNPGSFRIEIDAAKSGGVSDPRNGTMLKMFNLIDIGERAGSGIPNIFRVWREQNWTTPEITEQLEPERTTLTLLFSKGDDKKATIKSGDKKATIKSARQKEEIIVYLTDHISARSADIAELLGVKSTRAKKLLSELTAEDIVVAEGGNRNRTYKLKA